MDPNKITPKVYDYLWLYWILKQHGLTKDLIYLIIGTNKKLLLKFSDPYYTISSRPIVIDCSDTNISISKFNIEYYFLWDRKPEDAYTTLFARIYTNQNTEFHLNTHTPKHPGFFTPYNK